MKTKLMLSALILLIISAAQAQISLKLGSVENAEPGTHINIPLTITGVSSTGQAFAGIEVRFYFTDGILSFDSLTNGNPQTPVSEWFAGSQPGIIAANWISPTLQTIQVDDNSTLVEFVCFYSGGQTNLTLDPSITSLFDENGNPLVIDQLINGIVTQGQGSENSVWNGTGNWSTPANWSNGIPGDGTDAVIASGSVSISSGAVCRNLEITINSRIDILPGFSLTVNGNFNNIGELALLSDSLVRGSFICKGLISPGGLTRSSMQVYSGLPLQFSSPVQGLTAADLSGFGSLNAYSEPDAGWLAMNTSDPLNSGAGYAINPGTTGEIVFSGPFRNDIILHPLSHTPKSAKDSEGWNLVGNPYTSSFDSDHFLGMNSTDRAIYAWDGNRYRVWNGVAGNIPNGILPPMTGFFVRSSGPGASATFDPQGQIHDFSHFGSSYITPAYVLSLSVRDFDEPENEDIAFVQIEENSTFNFDGDYDAFKLSGDPQLPELYIHSADGYELSISAVPGTSDVIAGFNAPYEGTYEFPKIVSSFLPEKPVYLFDTETQITRDLRSEAYVFITNAGEYPERFRIILSGLGTGEKSGTQIAWITTSGNDIILVPMKDLGKTRVRITDLAGRLLNSAENDLVAGQTISLTGHQGMNFITLVTKDGLSTYKIIIP
jgi:hypothetical protein